MNNNKLPHYEENGITTAAALAMAPTTLQPLEYDDLDLHIINQSSNNTTTSTAKSSAFLQPHEPDPLIMDQTPPSHRQNFKIPPHNNRTIKQHPSTITTNRIFYKPVLNENPLVILPENELQYSGMDHSKLLRESMAIKDQKKKFDTPETVNLTTSIRKSSSSNSVNSAHFNINNIPNHTTTTIKVNNNNPTIDSPIQNDIKISATTSELNTDNHYKSSPISSYLQSKLQNYNKKLEPTEGEREIAPILPIRESNIFDYQKPELSLKTIAFINAMEEINRDRKLILERNNKSIKTVITKLSITIKKLHATGSLKIVFDDIKLITEIIVRSGYFIQIVRSFIRLMSELKNTEEFFSFLVECRKMIETINLVIKSLGNETQTREMFQLEDSRRRKLIKHLKYLIQLVLHNEELILLVKNISFLRKQVAIAKEEQRKAFPYKTIREDLKEAPITKEIIGALQSVAGEKVNIRLMFRNIIDVVNYVKNNDSYKNVIFEFTEIIRQIYATEESNLTIDLENRTRQSMDKLESMIIEICSLPPMVEFRVQSSLIFAYLNKDPINDKLIKDLKHLFKILKSEIPKRRIDSTIFKELKFLIIPHIVEKIRIIPLPNITNIDGTAEDRKKKILFGLENVNIEITKIDPNNIKVGLITCLEAVPLVLKGSFKSILSIEVTGLQVKIENVKWMFQKNSTPKIKDKGTGSLSSGTKGIDMKFKFSFSPNILEDKHFCKILKAKCKINEIEFVLHNCKHNTLYKTIYKLFHKRIKEALENAIIGKISEKINELEKSIYDIIFEKEPLPKEVEQSKCKREKILERIVTEIPQSSKTSRRFSIYSKYQSQNAPSEVVGATLSTASEGYVSGNPVVVEKKIIDRPVVNNEPVKITPKQALLHRRRSSLPSELIDGKINRNTYTLNDPTSPKIVFTPPKNFMDEVKGVKGLDEQVKQFRRENYGLYDSSC
eukprot:gene5372-6703_t